MDLWVAVAAVVAGQVVKGCTGFGSALVAVPILGLARHPAEAIFLVQGVDLITGSWLAFRSRRDVAWTPLAVMLPGLLVGQWIGTGLLARLDPETVRRVLGTCVAVLALGLARPGPARDGETQVGPPGTAVVAGFVAGGMSGLVGMPGPPLVVWTRRYLADHQGRATLLAIFVIAGLGAATMLLGRGLVEPGLAAEVPLLVPGGLCGAWVGAWLAPRVPRAVFAGVVSALMAVVALVLVW